MVVDTIALGYSINDTPVILPPYGLQVMLTRTGANLRNEHFLRGL